MTLNLKFVGYEKLDSNPALFNSAAILASLALRELKEFSDPERVEIIKNGLTDIANNPPAFDLGHYWAYPEVAAAIGAAKRASHIWNTLDQDIIDKLSLIMEIFLYLGAFATQRNNNYHTGFAWHGNFSKKWNPNYQLSYYPLMCYCIDFFGSIETANSILINFDYDTLMEKVSLLGFDRCHQCWNTTPCTLPNGTLAPTAKELLENGGTAFIKDGQGNILFAGGGESIKQPYMHRKGGLWYLPKDMITECYNGGACKSEIDINGDGTFDGHILDNTTSPFENQPGMFTELNTTSGTNLSIRSSLLYSIADFVMITTLIAYIKEIGWFNLDWDENLFALVKNGNGDLFYKADHGYIGAGMAKEKVTPESINNNCTSFKYWRDYWNDYLTI